MDNTAQKLTPLQQEILKRWQKKSGSGVSQEVKDELTLKFDGEVLLNEPMSLHSTMRVGGKASIFLKPRTKDALKFAIRLAEERGLSYFFHGGGSNTLVKDGGVSGFVISTLGVFTHHEVREKADDHIDLFVESGLSFPGLLVLAKDLGAADLAPLTGIPGSVGGAVLMNAGVPTREMKDVVRSITVITRAGEEIEISREKLPFEYRGLKIPRTLFLLGVLLRFQDLMNPEDVKNLMKQHQQKRIEKQPLHFPSLGCVFKNPIPQRKGEIVASAGQLIDEAGLKNIRIGGARVSPQHANFIINEGNATAKDVLALIGLIKDKVRQTSGVMLETEIRVIGEEEGK